MNEEKVTAEITKPRTVTKGEAKKLCVGLDGELKQWLRTRKEHA